MERKTILIVGASRGIGAAVSKKMEQAGWLTLNASRSFETEGNNFSLDVRSPESVTQAFDLIAAKNIKLDALLFCSGIGHFAPINEITHEQWNDSIATNLSGAFYVLQKGFTMMKNNNGGKLLVIGSIADHVALPDNAAYAASKFGLRGLTSVLHEEGRSFNVSTTLISLGATYTEIWKSREGFNPDDMLKPKQVADLIYDIAKLPLSMSLPNVTLTPPKGVL